VFEYLNACLEELALVLPQGDDPLLLLELAVASHEQLLANFGTFENDLEGIFSLSNL
jgi:hypothetical protein